jgi:hypothetical protein
MLAELTWTRRWGRDLDCIHVTQRIDGGIEEALFNEDIHHYSPHELAAVRQFTDARLLRAYVQWEGWRVIREERHEQPVIIAPLMGVITVHYMLERD